MLEQQNPVGAGIQTKPVNVSPSDLPNVVCEECSGIVFSEGAIIKTVSPILTKNGKEGMMPIPAFYCVKCGTPVDKFLPEELQKPKLTL